MADSIVAGVLRVNGFIVIQRHDEDGMTTWSRVVEPVYGGEVTLVLTISEVIDHAALTATVKGRGTVIKLKEGAIADVASDAVVVAHEMVWK